MGFATLFVRQPDQQRVDCRSGIVVHTLDIIVAVHNWILVRSGSDWTDSYGSR